jgi:uncharacterized lipoprotein YmbA
VLAAVPRGAASGASGSPELAVSVGPIELPDYLRRRQIVRRAQANELRASDAEIWGEDLAAGFTRVLGEDLSALIPTDRITTFPEHEALRPDYRLIVVVERFEPDADGVVRLDARWRLVRSDGREALVVRRSSLAEPVDGTGTLATVDAMSRALAALAREIAAALRAG